MSRSCDVLGIGLNATDTLLLVKEFPPYAGKVAFDREMLSPGGQVATAIVTCARLGLRAKHVGTIGDDLRGEDKLPGRSGTAFAVRFHLHPSVETSLVPDGSAVQLRLPSGLVWRLRATGAEMSLAESIYLGSGELKTTQQVVLSGTTGASGASVRWAIRRETRASEL